MELVKELPEIFEEFAEQRQRSFLVMKEVKDKGIPVVGAYCTYFPQEIAMAMGAVTVGLCSTSDETIPIAEKDLPKNLCPMVEDATRKIKETKGITLHSDQGWQYQNKRYQKLLKEKGII